MQKLKIKNKKSLVALVFLIILSSVFFFYNKRGEKIIFVGDMFFDRHIRRAMYANGEDFVFSCIGDFLKSADFAVGNLEGPVTENASVSLVSAVGAPENYRFTFPTNVPSLLYKNNIHLVNLGNNHISNFGKNGVESTKKYLKEAGIKYFGGFYGDEPVFREDELSFVSYNEFGAENKEKIAEKIKKEKEKGQTVIVYAHWGEEYAPAPQRIKNTARLFAESGASLIIGSHPHVILQKEVIGNTTVYYSLGNFIFDQYWNKEVSTGLALEVKIKGNDLDITEHKVSMEKDGKTCLTN